MPDHQRRRDIARRERIEDSRSKQKFEIRNTKYERGLRIPPSSILHPQPWGTPSTAIPPFNIVEATLAFTAIRFMTRAENGCKPRANGGWMRFGSTRCLKISV